jgi:glycine cleavage system H protein
MPEFLEAMVDKFLFRVATDRLYQSDGIWVQEMAEADRVRIGVTDFMQQRNGDAAFVHVRPAGTRVTAREEFAELETIKSTVSLYTPLSGEIVEVNPALDLKPEVVNQDPYGQGWLAVLAPSNWQADQQTLLDPQAYWQVMRSQAEEEQNKP